MYRNKTLPFYTFENIHLLLMMAGGVCNDGTRAGYFHDTNVTKQGKKVELDIQLQQGQIRKGFRDGPFYGMDNSSSYQSNAIQTMIL